MKFILKTVLNDLISQKKINSFFILNIVLGFIGFLGLNFFQNQLSTYTEVKAKDILAGDITISARRFISESEIKDIEYKIQLSFIEKAKSIELFAMASNLLQKDNNSRLINIKGITENYPIYGSIDLDNKNINELKNDKLGNFKNKNDKKFENNKWSYNNI